MIRRRVVVDGRVQGVGFRESCRRQATHVNGWVRNLEGGRVEAVFEGEPAAVEAMVDWCRSGPPWATVTAVEVYVEEPQGDNGFTVR
ncbi:MAG TPA: acylphosphatase [Acidimicrobiales bacterium]|nr:acylphosphatase [Acidimicrobiales bacterium]